MAKDGHPHLRSVPDCGRDFLEGSGPYKSGRISCLETPEIFSKGRTRSAGIPFFRQLYSDCGRMPNASVTTLYPPAPSRIRSSMSSMQQTLQPKAGNGQQPKAVIQLHSILGMTSPAKIKAKEQFGIRLSAVLDALRWEKKKRPERLRLVMLAAGVNVTYETARTWIAGTKVPSGAHIQIMCEQLGLSPTYLQTGQGEMFVTDPGDQELAEIQRRWARLGPASRAHLLQTLRMAEKAELGDDSLEQAPKRAQK
jgi:hypothetical protein